MNEVFRTIKEVLDEKHPEIDQSQHIWQQLITTSIEYGMGWYELVIEFTQKVADIYERQGLDIIAFEYVQIKEKYGLLEIYTNCGLDEVSALIKEYEDLSEHTCEECGNKGTLKTDGCMVRVRCDQCENEEKAEALTRKHG